MQITIDFTYPIQDSVSVGDTAYYVYTNESGGFDINSANVVEIGEILSINRTGVSGGSILCNTELYGNELMLGCGGIGTSIDCGDSSATATSNQQTTTPPPIIECDLSFGEFAQQSNALVDQVMGLHNEYVSTVTASGMPTPPTAEMNTLRQQLLTLTQTAWDCGVCEETPSMGEPSNCCHTFSSMGITLTVEKESYMNNPAPTYPLEGWYNDMISFATELQDLSCEGTAQEAAPYVLEEVEVEETTSGDCGPAFILFSKNNCQNLKSLLGYYSLFRFVNNSKDKAELFNITVDAYESSK
jgi:hypothetical protein